MGVNARNWGSGRSDAGNLRNFKQMSDEKLLRTLYEVRSEDNDGEALDKLEEEAKRRGLDIYADTESLVRAAIEKLEHLASISDTTRRHDLESVLDLLEAALEG